MDTYNKMGDLIDALSTAKSALSTIKNMLPESSLNLVVNGEAITLEELIDCALNEKGMNHVL